MLDPWSLHEVLPLRREDPCDTFCKVLVTAGMILVTGGIALITIIVGAFINLHRYIIIKEREKQFNGDITELITHFGKLYSDEKITAPASALDPLSYFSRVINRTKETYEQQRNSQYKGPLVECHGLLQEMLPILIDPKTEMGLKQVVFETLVHSGLPRHCTGEWRRDIRCLHAAVTDVPHVEVTLDVTVRDIYNEFIHEAESDLENDGIVKAMEERINRPIDEPIAKKAALEREVDSPDRTIGIAQYTTAHAEAVSRHGETYISWIQEKLEAETLPVDDMDAEDYAAHFFQAEFNVENDLDEEDSYRINSEGIKYMLTKMGILASDGYVLPGGAVDDDGANNI